METSKEGKDFIKAREGLELVVYKDDAGFATIGYGHMFQKHEEPVEVISEEEADRLFEEDCQKAELCVSDACKTVALQQHEFDALVSFTFNVGCGAFRSSTLLRELLASRPVAAAEQFKRWVYAGGKVNKGLAARRRMERHLFITGEYL